MPDLPLSSALILVVDDDHTNCEVLRLRLEKLGAGVVIASGGVEALEVLEGESSRSFDAVLMDYMMPDINGLTILRRLRENRSAMELPVIMQTARTDSLTMIECLNSGANDYVTKPIDFPVLVARLQTHLSLSRLSAEKDTFLAMASHDLKTPLATVRGFTSLLLDLIPVGDLMSERGHDILCRILNQSRSMERIVSDFLDINAIENGQLRLNRRTIDLSLLVQDCVADLQELAASKHICLGMEFGAHQRSWLAQLDRDRIMQVLDNVVGNALKFCNPGSLVRIRLSQSLRFHILEISDTGPGLLPSEIAHVFEKHFRGSNKATGAEKSSGLGLCISRWLVQMHRGKITVRNHGPKEGPGGVDHGLNVRIQIPMESDDAAL
jgi:two-component system sensor histidine kinase/response regulator